MIKVDETDPVGGESILSTANGILSEKVLRRSHRLHSPCLRLSIQKQILN